MSGTNTQAYYRAVRFVQGPPKLSLQSVEGPVYRFKLSSEATAQYAIQTTTNLPPVISWEPVLDLMLTNGWGVFDWTNQGERQRFFRGVRE